MEARGEARVPNKLRHSLSSVNTESIFLQAGSFVAIHDTVKV